MNEPRYPITYDIRQEDPPLTADEVRAQGRSATQAIVFVSLLYQPDGSFSMLVESRDGRTKDRVSANELFKVWLLLATRLKNAPDLSVGKRQLADLCEGLVWDALKQAHNAPKET